MLLNAYCTHRAPPALDFPHALRSRRDRSDPELGEHLRGFMGFIMGGGARAMSQSRYHVLRHVERVQHQLALEVDEADMDAFAAWARAANAVVFLKDGSVRAPDGKVLVDPETGDAHAGAVVPHPPDAVERKARSEAALAALGVRVPDGLPPVVSEVEVALRDGEEIARRCLALFACAVRAESMKGPEDLPADEIARRMPLAEDAMSPRERAFFRAAVPERHDVVDHVWRYEALALLLWALELAPELPLPMGVCDVAWVARTIVSLDGASFVRDARRRPTRELLDALDLHLRLHWATTEASVRDAEPPGGVLPGAVLERHYALNWLTCFEDAEWDDVTTPT